MNMDFDVNKVFQDRLAESMGLDKYQSTMIYLNRARLERRPLQVY